MSFVSIGRPPVRGVGERRLLLRHGDAGADDAVALGGELEEAAPARADVEHGHPRLETDLAADQVELCFLRLVEGRCVLPVAAGIDHPLVEHPLVEIVADVVVLLGDLGDLGALRVEDRCAERLEDDAEVELEVVFEVGGRGPVDRAIEIVAVPPAVHVALADGERAIAEDAGVEAVVMDPDVPGTRAVDLDVGLLEEVLEEGFWLHG